ncbi:MAG TPA: hypothetical protein ENI85_06970 [Deltaproteobacteria bacterium]|nr:hypothetical protein [Deltaproteobacteria bacterium]
MDTDLDEFLDKFEDKTPTSDIPELGVGAAEREMEFTGEDASAPALDSEPSTIRSSDEPPDEAALDFDDLLDFEALDEFDPDASASFVEIRTRSITARERNAQLARELARKHDWHEPGEFALLEELIVPLKRPGRRLAILNALLEEGVTSAELRAAWRLRQQWASRRGHIGDGAKLRAAPKRWFTGDPTWVECVFIARSLGIDLDAEEMAHTLDGLRDDWLDGFARQQAGRPGAFHIPDNFREYVLEYCRSTTDCDLGDAKASWLDRINLHALHTRLPLEVVEEAEEVPV